MQAAPSGTLKDNLLQLNIRRDSDGVATEVSCSDARHASHRMQLKVLPNTTVRQLKGMIQKKKVFVGATPSNMSLAYVGQA